jgi:large subunit ribosomal protein L29
MKNKEIVELTTKEIIEKIGDEKIKLTKLRLNHAVSPLDNPMILKDIKKDIARLYTELRKRELSENK